MEPGQSLAVMRERSAAARDISGQGAVTLINPKGESVRLNAAFVFAPPDRARVRAYKFGQAVLDLTVTPESLWLFLPRRDAHEGDIRSGSANTGRAIRQWLLLIGGPSQSGAATTHGGKLVLTRNMEDGSTLRTEIDRATLTARQYVLSDAQGTERFRLTLDHYRQVQSIVWPGRIVAQSAMGKIVIEMRDVELNAAPPGAFDPPARAEKLP
jgi:outer membrane lipoprotein-sorting protein